MTIRKKISLFLLAFVGLFAIVIVLKAFWLNSIRKFLEINLFHDLTVARNYEELASSWLSLRLRSPEAPTFHKEPVFWLASSSLETIPSLENEQKLLLVGKPRFQQFEEIQAHSRKLWKKVQLVQNRDYSSWLQKLTSFFPNSENFLEIVEEIREDREKMVTLCREEASVFRTTVEERVQKLLIRIQEQYTISFLLFILAFFASLFAVFYLPRVIADPIVTMCKKFKQVEPGQLIPISPLINIHEIDLLEKNFQSLVVRIKTNFDAIKRYISTFGQIWGIFSTLYQNKNPTLAGSIFPGLMEIFCLCIKQLPKISFIRIFIFIEDQKNIYSCFFPSDSFSSSNQGQEFFKQFSMKINSMERIPASESFKTFLKSSALWTFSRGFFPKDSISPSFPRDWPENYLKGFFCVPPLFHSAGWSQTSIDSIDNDDKRVFGMMLVYCETIEIQWSEEELTFLNLISSQVISLIETGHLLHKSLQAQRFQFQLDLAREIQANALPQKIPVIEGLKIEAICQMADVVGGDFYDFFELGNNRLGVIIADISGKSISAAFRMMVLKTLIKTFQMISLSPGKFLTELNKLVCQNFSAGSFVTMVYFVIDLDRKKVVVANAGHLPIICYSSSTKALKELTNDGCPLGIIDYTYEEIDYDVSSGDFLLTFTDGVVECKNSQKNLFGLSSLKDFVSGFSGSNFVQEISRTLASFRGDAPISDDVTIVTIKLT